MHGHPPTQANETSATVQANFTVGDLLQLEQLDLFVQVRPSDLQYLEPLAVPYIKFAI